MSERLVGSAEYEAAWNNPEYQRVMHAVLRYYRGVMDQDDLRQCAMDALWKCLAKHDDASRRKFTTSLTLHTMWECRNEIRRRGRRKNRHGYSIQDVFPEPLGSNELEEHVQDCVNLLPPQERTLVRQHFWEGLTYQEVGARHGYGKDTARKRIGEALDRLRRCISL